MPEKQSSSPLQTKDPKRENRTLDYTDSLPAVFFFLFVGWGGAWGRKQHIQQGFETRGNEKKNTQRNNIASAKLPHWQGAGCQRITHEKILLRSITGINLGQHTQVNIVNELDARNGIVQVGKEVARDPAAPRQNVAHADANWPHPGARAQSLPAPSRSGRHTG